MPVLRGILIILMARELRENVFHWEKRKPSISSAHIYRICYLHIILKTKCFSVAGSVFGVTGNIWIANCQHLLHGFTFIAAPRCVTQVAQLSSLSRQTRARLHLCMHAIPIHSADCFSYVV